MMNFSCELISNLGIFTEAITTTGYVCIPSPLLWIDFKSWYIYRSNYNELRNTTQWELVVNWFQILVYLPKQLQLYQKLQLLFQSCELISNLGIFTEAITTIDKIMAYANQLWIDFKSWYIYRSNYNVFWRQKGCTMVVNWFQILVYLPKQLQQRTISNWFRNCCELISNLGIFTEAITTSDSLRSANY